jgi:hypothetical protein
MVTVKEPISLFRAVERVPPRDKDYLSSAAKGRRLPENASQDMIDGWDALSGWDTIEAACRTARLSMSLHWVVRYDIPAGARLQIEPRGGPGHYDIRGDVEELKQYLVVGSEVRVDRETEVNDHDVHSV